MENKLTGRGLSFGRAALATGALMCPVLASALDQNWIETSNEDANLVLESMARFSPEGAGGLGVDGLDEEIMDIREGARERSIADSKRVLTLLRKRLDEEEHPFVRQDIGILIKAIEDNIASSKLQHEHMLPYLNVNQQIFGGIRALIDTQIPRERYPAAIVRIRRYAGLEDDYTPVTELAKARSRERFDVDSLIGPYKGEVEQDLQRSATFIDGISELMEGTDLQGWQEPYETLKSQMQDYDDWVRAEILPRARDDYRSPRVMYEDALRNWGVDESPERLILTIAAG